MLKLWFLFINQWLNLAIFYFILKIITIHLQPKSNMKEEFLHFIWKQELFEKQLIADTGEEIEVISTGMHNHDSGPDFINARIKINNTIWAGNIEIHTRSENWKQHKHHIDPAYNNVILHIVASKGAKCFRQNGEQLPTAELQYRPELYLNFQDILKSSDKIPCAKDLKLVDVFTVKIWFDSLCIDRIESKTNHIRDALSGTNNNWEEAFFHILSKSFGFKTNSLPFELLAKSIPIRILVKYSSNIYQLEALLFGQAGFLYNDFDCEYHLRLRKEYSYLKKIHKLSPIEQHLWKFLRLRPSNFPTVRIAQFAALINKSKHLLSKIIETENINDLRALFDCRASEYWNEHYNFGSKTTKKEKKLGKAAIDGILINTIIPFVFYYGKNRMRHELIDRALTLLSKIPAEVNSIIRKWRDLDIIAKNAAESQALIQLTNNYCNSKNCLYCQLGNEIIRKKN